MKELDALTSEDFEIQLGARMPPKAMRLSLLATEQCAGLRAAIEQRTLTADSLRAWVESLLAEFNRGEPFVYESALAVLAVCLEPIQTPFAEEYLRDLARLDIIEMTLCSGVARECLRQRLSMPANVVGTFEGQPVAVADSAKAAILHGSDEPPKEAYFEAA